MRGSALALALALAACGGPPRREREPAAAWPTLDPDAPRRTRAGEGLAALRRIAAASAVALEVGSERATLLAFECRDGGGAAAAPSAPVLPHALPAARACYRCVLAVLDDGPQDPYGPHPLDGALRTLADALARYPDSFVHAANIRSLALCGSLADATGVEVRPFAGLADQERRRMLIQIGPDDGAQVGRTLHHELFHLFDFGTSTYVDDPAWERLNPEGFTYQASATTPVTGFFDEYAQTDLREDKATVFQAIMTNGDELCARGVDDPILLAKARLLRDRIARALPAGDAAFLRRSARCL